MAMKLSAFNKLRKTMMMTTSPNDSEALSALRIANRVIAEEGYTWDDVFSRLVKTAAPEIEEAPAEMTEAERIEDAFRRIETNKRSNSFIQSLREQWHDRKSLSRAQKEALFSSAAKCP